MNNTKIDWCNSTLNPVIGCKNNCEYCYARKMNQRFHFTEDFTDPQYFLGQLEKLKIGKGRSIFMNSMSDIYFWRYTAINYIAGMIEKYNHHQYIFLTNGKNIGRDEYNTSHFSTEINFPNTFIGVTITDKTQLENLILSLDYATIDFISIEPLLEPITLPNHLANIKSIIVGAETGNRKGKIKPKKEWVLQLQQDCKERGIKLFMKDSLKAIMGNKYIQGELLWKI